MFICYLEYIYHHYLTEFPLNMSNQVPTYQLTRTCKIVKIRLHMKANCNYLISSNDDHNISLNEIYSITTEYIKKYPTKSCRKFSSIVDFHQNEGPTTRTRLKYTLSTVTQFPLSGHYFVSCVFGQLRLQTSK